MIIFSIILFFRNKLIRESQKRAKLEKEIKEISDTDELTAIYNRKMSIKMLKKSIEISKRYERPLCVIFFDIDNFKSINELYSHEIADQTLKELAIVVSSNIRTTDIFGRWEGEEFILILPETSCEEATTSAKNLKNLIYNQDFNHLKTYITCSFSVVSYEKEDDIDSIVKKSTRNLSYVKAHGKNDVKVG